MTINEFCLDISHGYSVRKELFPLIKKEYNYVTNWKEVWEYITSNHTASSLSIGTIKNAINNAGSKENIKQQELEFVSIDNINYEAEQWQEFIDKYLRVGRKNDLHINVTIGTEVRGRFYSATVEDMIYIIKKYDLTVKDELREAVQQWQPAPQLSEEEIKAIVDMYLSKRVPKQTTEPASIRDMLGGKSF